MRPASETSKSFETDRRPIRYVSGSSNIRSSRLAEPGRRSTTSPGCSVVPCSSMSSTTVRARNLAGRVVAQCFSIHGATSVGSACTAAI